MGILHEAATSEPSSKEGGSLSVCPPPRPHEGVLGIRRRDSHCEPAGMAASPREAQRGRAWMGPEASWSVGPSLAGAGEGRPESKA